MGGINAKDSRRAPAVSAPTPLGTKKKRTGEAEMTEGWRREERRINFGENLRRSQASKKSGQEERDTSRRSKIQRGKK